MFQNLLDCFVRTTLDARDPFPALVTAFRETVYSEKGSAEKKSER